MARFIFLGILALMLAMPGAATAQDGPVAALLECRQIADSAKRLTCFDDLADEFMSEVGKTPEPEAPEAGKPGAVDGRVTGESAASDDAERSAGTRESTTDVPGAEPESGVVSGGRDAATSPSRPERVTSAEDLPLPYRAQIDSFASNRHGDYRFRIGEGIVFERAGGPGVPSSDLTGAEVTLSKNFLGQWRARVEGQPRELWVSPIRR